MSGNDNVIIYTEDKESKRSILNFILEYLGIAGVLNEKSIEIRGSLSNEIISNIIKKVIMEERMKVVTVKPEKGKAEIENQQETGNEEETKEQESAQEEKTKKQTKESISTGKEEVSLKEKVYNFICENKEVTNAQIIEIFQIRADYTYSILNGLCKEAKIEKVKRGKWRLKQSNETEKIVEEQQKKEENLPKERKKRDLTDLEKEVYLFIKEKVHVEYKEVIQKFNLEQSKASNILAKLSRRNMVKNVNHGNWEVVMSKEDHILALLANGWQMTEDEISIKTNIELEEVSKILKELLKTKKIKKVGKEYKLQEDLFGVFKQDKYKVLLDYIMSLSRFSIAKIKSKYPEEFSKLSELILKISPRYIREEKDAKETYVVHVKGRILYYIMNHENATFNVIKANFNLISSQEISNALNSALREGTLEKNKNGGYKVVKML